MFEERLMQMNVCNPDKGNAAIRAKGRQEFYDFVRNTYEGLYAIKSRIIAGRPIGIFCRLDVSLMIDTRLGQVDYFVNEIERTHTCSLWSNRKVGPTSSRASIGTLSDTFAEVFYNWLLDLSNPYVC
jgi:hypothetical protein